MARQFRLQNSQGKLIDMNTDDLFSYSPEGLGINISNSYYGSDINFMLQSAGLAQNVIKLNLMFGGGVSKNPYKDYNDFVLFIDDDGLKLQYSVPGIGELLRDVRIKELTKSEINAFQVIDESLTLECTSPWYQWVTGSVTRYIDQAGDGKIFSNVDMDNNDGFYVHDFAFEEDYTINSGQFSIQNNSTYFGMSIGAPLELKITAINMPIVNPSWELYKDGVMLQSDGYYVTIPIGDTLVISSDPTDLRAELVHADGTTVNVYQNQNMAKTNFIRVPKGITQIKMGDLLKQAKVEFRVKNEYVIV